MANNHDEFRPLIFCTGTQVVSRNDVMAAINFSAAETRCGSVL